MSSSRRLDSPDASPRPNDAKVYERRALIGGIALAIRTGITQLVILGGTIILARQLGPSEFGAFAIVQFSMTFLALFGDAGLGGALIQKKIAPTQTELSSVFFVQLGIGIAVLALSGVAGEALPRFWRDLPPSSPWILRALALSFVFTSLRVVPTILMERELQFVRLALLDTLNSLAFYLVAATLSLLGVGIWSLVFGVVAQGTVTMVMAFVLRPWRPSAVFDRASIKPLLGFGIPFQGKSVLGLLIAAVVPVVGGRFLGSVGVGLINWAQQTAAFPVTLAEIVNRVSFPLYSRMQDDRVALAATLDRALRVAVAGTFSFSVVLASMPHAMTRVIYGDAWLPASTLLVLFAGGISIGIVWAIVPPIFDALGRPLVNVGLWGGATVAYWVVVPVATHFGGMDGLAIGIVSVQVLANLVVLVIAKRVAPGIRIARVFLAPAVASVPAFALGRFVLEPHAKGPFTLVIAVLAVLALFASVFSLVDRSILDAIRSIRRGAPSADLVDGRE